MLPTEKVCTLIPDPGGSAISHGKRDFAGVIEVKVVKWADYPG